MTRFKLRKPFIYYAINILSEDDLLLYFIILIRSFKGGRVLHGLVPITYGYIRHLEEDVT